MKYDYSASDFNPIGLNGLTINSESINDSLIDCDHIQRIKKDIELLANDTSKDLNALQSELNYISAKIYKNRAIAEERIEKLQKDLQEFKKATNEFQRHLTGVSIILSVAVVFILILISFYSKF
jgi:predicted RNase H-like nuclease (RuvC/YqgF family)